jgi:2-polyprenyl-3-methyl-5-hydroxy-6-metoxy-1,4-benzoquinol methylase
MKMYSMNNVEVRLICMALKENQESDSDESPSAESMDAPEKEKLTLKYGDKLASKLWKTTFSGFEIDWAGKKVLDFGCQWGYLSKFLLANKEVSEAYGVDIYPKWEHISDGWSYKSVPNLHLLAGNIVDLEELQDVKFDIFTSAGTMFLLSPSTLEEVLIWMYNHLNPGGSAVFRTRSVFSHVGGDLHTYTKVPHPHLLFPRHIIDDFLQETSGSSSRYTSPMSSSSYLMLFHRVGFEIIDVVKLSSGIKDKDINAMFQDKLWFYSKDELNSGGIIVHLKKPIIERDISELEV